MMRAVLVRIKSHRARQLLGRLIERELTGFYSIALDITGIYDLSQGEYDLLMAEKRNRPTYWHSSVTKARVDRDALSACWRAT